MKLEESVDAIRSLIFKAIDKSLSQMGLMAGKEYDLEKVPADMQVQRLKIDRIISNLICETGNYALARAKLIDELSFTLFNRIAGVKVAETHQLIPDIFTRNAVHGGRSFGHKLWLEQNPDNAGLKLDGLREYVRYEFDRLSKRVQLYSSNYLYDMLPDVFDLNAIIEEFNKIEESDWMSDDIMGWMYESYNNSKKREFKESGEKIEYDKVSLTSQFYTPRWVVKFLIDNSLGKLYLEMYPNSDLKKHHDIANAPSERVREPKPIEEIRLIDPAPGSGNFLLYAFDLFYEMYVEQGYDEKEIPRLIIENNLYGVDIDDRAIQIAQLGLYIKALRKNRDIRIDKFNIVSTDFYLPEYDAVKSIFEQAAIDKESRELLQSIWEDLRQAHKFGSLIHLEEKVNAKIDEIKEWAKTSIADLTAIQSKWEKWKEGFIPKLKDAVSEFPSERATGFLKSKTIDSLTFVEILTRKYDVAVANPPYTDSGNYGPQLQQFIKDNYKKPFDFYSNIYSCFIKRCTDLILEDGKIAMVHPPTFMYIKTFEDVRKYILNSYHISLFVEWGYLGMFNPSARVDSAMYILEGKNNRNKSVFIKLNDLYETKRKDALFRAYQDYLSCRHNNLVYIISQEKLKLIKSYPFIYWISDEFREKFKEISLEKTAKVAEGLTTANNYRFLRFWWEIDSNSISQHYRNDKKRWVLYAKGGPYNKYYGNVWTVIDWDNNGEQIKIYKGASVRNEKCYFKEGITFSSVGSKGVNYRILNKGFIFDSSSRSIFFEGNANIYYSLGFLNSRLAFYIANCLNPTVSTTVGDIQRIPYVIPNKTIENKISSFTSKFILIKKLLCEFSIIELDYKQSCISWRKYNTNTSDLCFLIKYYLNYENQLLAQIFINEAIINEIIFEVYNLSEADKAMVLAKDGIPVGSRPVIPEAREDFLKNEIAEFPLDVNVKEYIQNLPAIALSEEQRQGIIALFPSLYQSNNDLEEFCIKQNINPINVWYLFKNSNVVPSQRAKVIAMELLVDVVRGLLAEDDDGIIPLVEYAGESTVQKRVYDKLIAMGFTNAQYDAFRTLLGKDINDYMENSFFKDLSDHLNLFMYLPKTPFIWHLSSGENQGFDVYISIYKWSRDKLMRLRSVYLEKRESSLKNRLIDLARDDSIKAQSEKETIQKQLAEIQQFKTAIDEILRSGYDPILDDGVGKNIAPLQEKGLLKAEVLNKSQLRKYLNADW